MEPTKRTQTASAAARDRAAAKIVAVLLVVVVGIVNGTWARAMLHARAVMWCRRMA
jgi:hypothetical protein